MRALIATVFALVASLSHATEERSTQEEFRFQVLLDGRPIGYHRFLLRDHGPLRELISEARLNVRIFLINAYRYTHDDREIWSNGCLQWIDSRTDDNGKKHSVHGSSQSQRFVVASSHGVSELKSCVMTFAYWNPRILDATQLLNPQTGEYVAVRVSHLGTESIVADDGVRSAERYRLAGSESVGGKLQIDLWYSRDQEWLALESVTPEGHRLRYQRERIEGERHASLR